MKILWQVVHQRMKEIGGEHWKTGGCVVIAFDGSRDPTPRTKANQAAFCAPNHGKGKTAKFRKKKTKDMRRTNNEKDKLSVTQIRNIYKQRWGIEVEFRGLKQTLDKAELRCRNEVRIRTELHWSLMAMTIAELFALKVQL